ncbi:NAC domain-containing protein 71-like [Abrus precatorius]|uniref:NAC domain-containing protein 71-like n=1 Tax=Abrus precatorius TaxID=3816 RepID=A0A8B8JNW4_ABRPR|nr:NAC domain-containing protein 71-like [Abrus precatorius]
MEDQHRATLPPGCRFHPSEELLLRYYLTNKNENREGDFYGSDLIRELDLYGYDPFELPDAACFSYGYRGRKRHWFCYTVKVPKRGTRKVKSGFWLRKGRVRDVFGNGGNAVLGTRTRFVFYVGNSVKSATRTDWILYEYALVDRVLASFALCRVFNKPHQKNSPSEIGLSCYAEESVSAVRHVGVQCDGYVRSDVVEAIVCDDNRKNEITELPIRCGGEHDDSAALPVSVVQGSQQERLCGLPGGSAFFIEAVTSQQLLSILEEEDFIELNDIA